MNNHRLPRVDLDKTRLVSIPNEQLQGLKNARVKGVLARYRIIDPGKTHSIVEFENEAEAKSGQKVAKSAKAIDRNK
jgi:hypothetical protein